MRRALFAAILLGAATAHAGVEDTFGIGTKPMTFAGSYAARPGDSNAAYYNPAGLAPRGERGGFFEMSVGILYAKPTLWTRAPNGGLPSAPASALPRTDDAPETAGLFVGSRFGVGRMLGIEGLDAGFGLYIPPHLFRWSIRPDDDLQWALLTDRTQVLSADLGLAYRPIDWLSLGIGLRVLFDVQTLTRGDVTYVKLDTDPVTGKNVIRTGTRLGVDAQVFGRATPIFGALVSPTDRMRFGLVYRHQSFVDDWGNTRISGVPSFGDIGYTHRFAHYFEPSSVTLAASLDLGKRLDVSADVTYSLWSEAQSTNRNQWSSTGFKAPIWGNTVTPAFGARFRVSPALALMGGYRYQRSPLDNAGGPSNLLDTDKHVISAGLDLGVGATHLVVGTSYTLLDARKETKDFTRFQSDAAWMANPGYPEYTFGGHVLALSASMEVRF